MTPSQYEQYYKKTGRGELEHSKSEQSEISKGLLKQHPQLCEKLPIEYVCRGKEAKNRKEKNMYQTYTTSNT